METLTLKELAPYLPFELKVIWCDGKIDTINPLLSERNNVENEVSLQLALFAFEKEHIDLKPILYPLDYLTKPITHNGETFVPIEKLKNIYNSYPDSYIEKLHFIDFENTVTLFGLEEDDSYEVAMPYSIYEKLFEWRFDVFKLINRGLAIPITEDFNPYK